MVSVISFVSTHRVLRILRVNDSMKNKCKININRLSKIAGVNAETVRHYQHIGLIEKPVAPLTGHRKYSYKTANNIKFINCAKKLGFSLEEIRKLIIYWK